MAKGRQLEEQLERLGALRDRPDDPATLVELRAALAHRSPHVVAKAARVAGELELGGLAPDLEAAFGRLMDAGPAADKGCGAKTALAEALYRLDAMCDAAYLRGVRHRQPEPGYGGPQDTAVTLRGHCAMGLVRMGYPDATLELAHLLADPEFPARAAAARAIGYSERPDGVPLLRFKVLAGDREPEVVAECFTALMRAAPRASLTFVAGYLDAGDDAVAEAAAVAVGGSRLPEALAVLVGWHDRLADPAIRRTCLAAIALLRHDAALDFLLNIVRDQPIRDAADALAALAIYAHDDALAGRAAGVVKPRRSRELDDAFAQHFGRHP